MLSQITSTTATMLCQITTSTTATMLWQNTIATALWKSQQQRQQRQQLQCYGKLQQQKLQFYGKSQHNNVWQLTTTRILRQITTATTIGQIAIQER